MATPSDVCNSLLPGTDAGQTSAHLAHSEGSRWFLGASFRHPSVSVELLLLGFQGTNVEAVSIGWHVDSYHALHDTRKSP